MQKINIQELKEFISKQDPETKIYLGCDSYRYKKNKIWYASYTTVVVVHMAGKHGAKVFGEISVEQDFTGSTKKELSKPRLRLMNEVYKVAAMTMQLQEVLEKFDFEVHLDINPDIKHGSSCVVQEAVGYIRGTCNVIPLVKPQSFAATHCADRFRSYGTQISA